MALASYYVDQVSGNDTTGNGTSGNPWLTIQKAFNTITRSNEDAIFVAGNGSVSATWSLTTYGDRPSSAGHTYIVGTGGRPKITYSQATGLAVPTPGWNGFVFYNLEFEGTSGSPSTHDFQLNLDCGFVGCKLDLARNMELGVGSRVVACEILGGDNAFAGLVSTNGTLLQECYIHNQSCDFPVTINTDGIVDRCIILAAESAGNSVRRLVNWAGANGRLSNCVLVEGAQSYTTTPISNGSTAFGGQVSNNLFLSSRSGDIFSDPTKIWTLRGNRKHGTPTWGTGAGDVYSGDNVDDNDLVWSNRANLFKDPDNGDFRLKRRWLASQSGLLFPMPVFPPTLFPGAPISAALG